MMLLIHQVVGVAVERRGTLERFLGGRINKLRDQLQGEDVGEEESIMLPTFLC